MPAPFVFVWERDTVLSVCFMFVCMYVTQGVAPKCMVIYTYTQLVLAHNKYTTSPKIPKKKINLYTYFCCKKYVNTMPKNSSNPLPPELGVQ